MPTTITSALTAPGTAGPAALSRPARRAAEIGLLAACFAITLPFLIPLHHLPQTSFYAEWLAFALGLVALLAVYMAARGLAVPPPVLSIGLAALIVVIAAHAALGRIAYAESALLGACYALWAAALVLAGAQLRELLGEERVLMTLCRALAWGGVAAAALGFIQYYEVETPWGHMVDTQGIWTGYMIGSIGQRNLFSDYVSCGLVSLLFLHARGSFKTRWALPLAFGMALALALAASRSTFLFMAVAMIAMPFLRRADAAAFARLWRMALFALAVFLLAQAVSATTGLLDGPQGRPNTSIGHVVGAIADHQYYRPLLYLRSWHAFLSSPLLGVGLGGLASSMFWQAADAVPPVLPRIIDRYAHNLVLQLLAEFGIAGALAVLLPLVLWARSQFRRPLQLPRIWALAVLGIVGVHSMLEFPLWLAYFLGVAALLAGATSGGSSTVPAMPGAAVSVTPGAAVRLAEPLRLAALVLAACGVVLAGLYLSDYRGVEGWYQRIEADARAGRNVGGDELQELMRMHAHSLFVPDIERMASELIPVTPDGLADKLDLNTQVLHNFPSPSVAGRQAALLQLAGRQDEARRAVKAMVLLWPQQAKVFVPQYERLERQYPERFSGLAQYLRDVMAADKV